MLGIFTPSILWAIGGAVLAILIPIWTWALHTPSKVALAVSAIEEKARSAQLKVALIAAEERAAKLKEALETRAKYDKAKDEMNAKLSARVSELLDENNALKTPRSDDSALALSPDDPWLLRNAKARAAAGDRSKAR
jgi:hypothetical protein